jgi:hypothetical protein
MEIKLTASDFYYLPRVENLDSLFSKCEEKLSDLQCTFHDQLLFEHCAPHLLDQTLIRMEDVIQLMIALKSEKNRLILETCN